VTIPMSELIVFNAPKVRDYIVVWQPVSKLLVLSLQTRRYLKYPLGVCDRIVHQQREDECP
jgi:hypothetical protein